MKDKNPQLLYYLYAVAYNIPMKCVLQLHYAATASIQSNTDQNLPGVSGEGGVGRGRVRETDRQTDRETDRERNRQTDRTNDFFY